MSLFFFSWLTPYQDAVSSPERQPPHNRATNSFLRPGITLLLHQFYWKKYLYTHAVTRSQVLPSSPQWQSNKIFGEKWRSCLLTAKEKDLCMIDDIWSTFFERLKKILLHSHMLINMCIIRKICKHWLSIVSFISADVTHTPEIRWVLKFT